MKRMLAMALVVIGALGSNFALALGLGELKLNSALNENFDAEITITNIGDLSKNQILPNLASHEDFARAGVERVFFLTGIKFDVKLLGNGNALLTMKTDKIVREPFLNFLVEVHWPSGRLLREYTVLLDPPVFAKASAPIVRQATLTATPSAPARQAISEMQTRRDAGARAAATTVRSQPPVSRASSDGEGANVRVKKNDTLWGIAREHRPGSNVSVRQTMVAIQRHNPDAFIKNNINLLKAGQVLRIPDENEVLKVSYDQALAETKRQNQEWQGSKETIDATRTEDEKQSQSIDQEAAASSEEGQLKLISDEEANASKDLSSSASGTSVEADNLAQKDASSDTTVTAGEPESSSGGDSSIDLSAANDELLKQVEDLKRLVDLKDQQLALLQGATSGSDAESITKEETPVPADSMTAEPSDNTVEQFLEENKITDSAKGIINKLTENPLYIAFIVLGLLIVLMVFGAISRKRKQAQEYPVNLKETTDRADQEVSFDESLEEDLADIDIDEEVDTDTRKTESGSTDELSDDILETETDEIRKIIEESDIYIAYGRYERAIEILQPAINNNPDNTDLRLKLAEIFVIKKNQSGLTQLEADLLAIGDQDALDEFAALTRQEGQGEDTARMESLDDVTIDEDDLVEDTKKELGTIDFELPSDEEKEKEKEEKRPETKDEVLIEEDEDLIVELEEDKEKDKLAKGSSESVNEETMDVSKEKQKAKGADEKDKVEDSLDIEEDVEDLDFLGDTDESATKLELAKAYIDMADKEAALDMLNEVVEEGSDAQKEEARKLLEKLG